LSGAPIVLSAAQEDGEGVVRVKDAGIGISPQMLPQIFDIFVQARGGGSGPDEGLGIGLTLVKRLVELHGGHVEARSAGLGKGSEFRVRLPLDTTAVAGARPLSGDQPVPPVAESKRVLVVDDNRDAADSLRMLLELDGHKVKTAYDGSDALAAAREFQPEVVLLDLGLPDMSGHDVARRMAQDPLHKDVTLAALTGWGQAEDRARSAEAGFKHHLVKPVQPDELRRVLSRR
jgi:CheY-like chemotaxis protein